MPVGDVLGQAGHQVEAASRRPHLKVAAERGQALRHAPQARPAAFGRALADRPARLRRSGRLRRCRAAPAPFVAPSAPCAGSVVADLKAEAAGPAGEADVAVPRAGVADHVGGRLPQAPGEGCLHVRVEGSGEQGELRRRRAS